MLIHKYALNAVELTDPVLENAFRKEKEYLRAIKIDRLLAGFRETAGLPKKAERYAGGWENAEIAGHTLGHYMVAQAQLFDATRDSDARNRLNNLLLGLAECQAESGYLFATGEEIFDRLERGESAWVPWYTMHKLIAGLLAVYRYAKLPMALEIVGRLGEWVYNRVTAWDEETRKRVLTVEYGGMNDCLYELYKETGMKQFLEAAEKFDENDLYDDVLEGKNVLSGKHANTMIPKFVGAINRYIVVGDSEKKYLDASKAFFDMVWKEHTYATGGNSENEFFQEPRKLAEKLSRCNCETCNSYNMLKLAERLYRLTGEKKYMDCYETTYLNAILGSQNPETGMTTYFQPMAPGYFKTFGTPMENFWCCTGTGMENFTKLNNNIYHSHNGEIFVDLYVASVLHEMSLDVDLIQKTNLTSFDGVEFMIIAMKPKSFKLNFRIPDWTNGHIAVRVNGEQEQPAIQNGYASLEREWKAGDKVFVRFYPEVMVSTLPDNNKMAALTYGPFVLAAGLGNQDMTTETTGVNVTVPTKNVTVRESILITEGSVGDWFLRCRDNVVKGENLNFTLRGTDADNELTFSPYYQHYNDRYGVYFTFLEKDKMSAQELLEMEKKNGTTTTREDNSKKDKQKKKGFKLFRGIDDLDFDDDDDEEDDVNETVSKTLTKDNMAAPRPVQRPIQGVTKDQPKSNNTPQSVPQTYKSTQSAAPRPVQRPIQKPIADEREDVQTVSKSTYQNQTSAPRPMQKPIPKVNDNNDDVPQTFSQTLTKDNMSAPRPMQKPIPKPLTEEEEDALLQAAQKKREMEAVVHDEPEEVPQSIAKSFSKTLRSALRPMQKPISERKSLLDEDEDVPKTSSVSGTFMSSPRPIQRPIQAPTKNEDFEEKKSVQQPVKTEPVKSEPAKTEPVKNEPVKAEPVKTEPVKAEPVKVPPVAPVIELTPEEKEKLKQKVEQEYTAELQKELKDEVEKSLRQEYTNELKDEVRYEVRKDLKYELRPELKEQVTKELKDELHESLKGEVGDEVRKSLKEELRPEMQDTVKEDLRKELHENLKGEVSEEVRKKLRDEFHDSLKDEVSVEVRKNLHAELSESLKGEVGDEVRNTLRGELHDSLKDEVSVEVRKNLREELHESLKSEVSDTLRGELRTSLKDEIGAEVKEKLRGQLQDEMKDEVKNTLRSELHESLKSEVSDEVRGKLREELKDGLTTEVTASLRSELHDGLKNEVSDKLRQEFRSSLKDDVSKEIRAELHESLKQEVSDKLRSELHNDLKSEVSDSLRKEFRTSLKAEVTSEIRSELHDSLLNEVRDNLRGELRVELKGDVTKEIRNELHDSLQDEVSSQLRNELRDSLTEEVTGKLREEIRENLQERIYDEIKAEIKEETKDAVAQAIMIEEMAAARVAREKEEARLDAERKQRAEEEKILADERRKREEEEAAKTAERLQMEGARSAAELKAAEAKAQQEQLKLKMQAEEMEEKAKARKNKAMMRKYGNDHRVLKIVIPIVVALVLLVLAFVFAEPLTKGFFKAKNGIDRFLYNKMPGVAKALGITSDEKITPVFTGENEEKGNVLLENAEDYVKSFSPAAGYTASLQENNGVPSLCLEGEGVKVYYPTVLPEGTKPYVFVDNGKTSSMNYWDYSFDVSGPVLCPKKVAYNSKGTQEYLFTHAIPKTDGSETEIKYHFLDADSLKEIDFAPADDALAKFLSLGDCVEEEGKARLTVNAGENAYSFLLGVNGEFDPSAYKLSFREEKGYTMTDAGIYQDFTALVNGVKIGTVKALYDINNRMYSVSSMDFTVAGK